MRNITYPTLCFKDCSLIQAFLVFSQFAVFGIISILDSHSITDCHMAFAGRYMLTILLQEGAIPMDILKKKVIIQTETINILKGATCNLKNLKKTSLLTYRKILVQPAKEHTVQFIFCKVSIDVHIKDQNTY